MKLKELLLSTDFDMLIPALKKEGYLGIRQYREAYDILCHLTGYGRKSSGLNGWNWYGMFLSSAYIPGWHS
jgi:hypothetical protein